MQQRNFPTFKFLRCCRRSAFRTYVRLYRRATQSAWWTNADATVRARRALHLLTDEPAADARTRALLAQALQASGQGEVAAPELTLAQGEIQCIGSAPTLARAEASGHPRPVCVAGRRS